MLTPQRMVLFQAQRGNERLFCGHLYFYYDHWSHRLMMSPLLLFSLNLFHLSAASFLIGLPPLLSVQSDSTMFAERKTHRLLLASVLSNLLGAGSHLGIAFPTTSFESKFSYNKFGTSNSIMYIYLRWLRCRPHAVSTHHRRIHTSSPQVSHYLLLSPIICE